MHCRQAHRLVQDLQDGCLAERAELDRHLEVCAACRAYLALLERVSGAVQDEVRCAADEASLERLAARVQYAVEAEHALLLPAARLRIWRTLAAAAVLLVVFASGTLAGRTIWPRERVVTRVEKLVETRTRLVQQRVEVPVVRERVVSRTVRVPVFKTRVVIRYLPQPGGPNDAAPQAVAAIPLPAAAQPPIVMQYLPTPAAAPQVEYSESVRMAAMAAAASGR